jgi:UDP-hydrolysing UDP-N-acetyl-D-glucosamine 2-epimerase
VRRKIAVVTGTRAEYGILYWVLNEVQARPSLELQLIVTGMHMSPEFGLTYRQIEKDGFPICEKLEILLSADSEVAISTSIGLGIMRFASAFERLKPDILVLLGDRFESLAAATAALVARIPIGHIAGGHRTEGAMDEAIRHSITKMSHVHFTSIHPYRDRIVQMGEQPDRVFVTGTPSLDGIRLLRLRDRAELEETLGLDLTDPIFLVVYHPVTLEDMTAGWQMHELLTALAQFGRRCVFIMPNADTGGRIIFHKIREFVASNATSKAFVNLERDLYLNLMRFTDVMVGNSSSGIVEAPSFELPVVNIGDRQRGRVRAGNVIDCDYRVESIIEAIEKALDPGFKKSLRGLTNPQGDGYTSKRIVDILEKVALGEELLKKKFYNIPLSQSASIYG